MYKYLYDVVILKYIPTINKTTNCSELLMIISNDHSVNVKNEYISEIILLICKQTSQAHYYIIL